MTSNIRSRCADIEKYRSKRLARKVANSKGKKAEPNFVKQNSYLSKAEKLDTSNSGILHTNNEMGEKINQKGYV